MLVRFFITNMPLIVVLKLFFLSYSSRVGNCFKIKSDFLFKSHHFITNASAKYPVSSHSNKMQIFAPPILQQNQTLLKICKCTSNDVMVKGQKIILNREWILVESVTSFLSVQLIVHAITTAIIKGVASMLHHTQITITVIC